MDARTRSTPDTQSAELDDFLDALHQRFQYDFRGYARQSLERRVAQAIGRLGCHSLSELRFRLLNDFALLPRLLDLLTVQVSDLFRDPQYFVALREHAIPLLHTYPSIKIWVAGCSTGEEAWSLAILLAEEGLLDRSLIYATDISPRALERARAGIYAARRMSAFNDAYRAAGGKDALTRWFRSSGTTLTVEPGLRRRVVFADHSLVSDSVFSEVHLLSCRNVLIYFNRQLQYRVLELFAEALVRRGFLGLGARESLRPGAFRDHFAPIAGTPQLYRRRESSLANAERISTMVLAASPSTGRAS